MKTTLQKRLERGTRIPRLVLGKILSATLVLLVFSFVFFLANEWIKDASTPPRVDSRFRATPIPYTPFLDDLTTIMDRRFIPVGRECQKEDRFKANAGHGQVTLALVSVDEIPSMELVSEIAVSVNEVHRAYLANLYEPVDRIYIRDQYGMFFQLTWNSTHPNVTLRNLVWIGDQILAFEKSFGYSFYEIIGIDVIKREFVYFANLKNGACP